MLLHSSLQAQENFYWKWRLVNDSLHITGKGEGKLPVFLKLPASPVRENFENIYRAIDLIDNKQLKAFSNTVRTLSKLLVKPFAAQISSCQTIIITVDSTLINFPLEFLQAEGKPIALVRPVVFRLTENAFDGIRQLKLKKGLIIRDPTADPEDACASTFFRYPASTYKSAYRLSPASVRKGKDDDFLLISTHGYIDNFTCAGRILFKDSTLPPIFFSQNHFKLVYLDACQQGINWSYLSVLSKAAQPAFYLGPIVSNDSGESSTKTINWFFSEMKKNGGDPVKAIWQTRNHLFSNYNKKLSPLNVVNKAFIFRIYQF